MTVASEPYAHPFPPAATAAHPPPQTRLHVTPFEPRALVAAIPFVPAVALLPPHCHPAQPAQPITQARLAGRVPPGAAAPAAQPEPAAPFTPLLPFQPVPPFPPAPPLLRIYPVPSCVRVPATNIINHADSKIAPVWSVRLL